MQVRRQVKRAEWEKSLNEVQISKADLNRLVMDYLVIEGYKDAAQSFSAETGLSPQVDLQSIGNRMTVRSAIQRGNIEEAISRVNELDPEILDTNPFLFFRLQQQRLIELIRDGKVTEALTFAAEELAPRGEEHSALLSPLERTMALLLFEGAGSTVGPPAQVAELLTPAQRLKTAGEVNAAILASQNQDKDPKLPQLLKILTMGERLLAPDGPARIDFPRVDFDGAFRGTAAAASEPVASDDSPQAGMAL